MWANLKVHYERQFGLADSIIATLIYLVFAGSLLLWRDPISSFGGFIHTDDGAQCVSTIAGLSGSLLGFVIAGASILLSLDSGNKSAALGRLKLSQHYKEVFVVYIRASKFLAVTTLVAVATLLLHRSDVAMTLLLFLAWAVFASIPAVGRCIWVLSNIVGLVTD